MLWKEKVTEFEEFAESHNISKTVALDDFVAECKRKWNVKTVRENVDLPIVEATALIYNVNLSLGQYQAIRSLCLPFGINFPTRNKIDNVKNSLHPKINSQEMKASVNLIELLDETAIAILKDVCTITVAVVKGEFWGIQFLFHKKAEEISLKMVSYKFVSNSEQY